MTRQLKERLSAFVSARATNNIERIRFFMLLIGMMMLLIGMVLHICGFIGTTAPVMQMLSLGGALMIVTTFALYATGKLSLLQTINVNAIASQVFQSARIVYLAFETPDNYERTIVVNLIVSFTIVIYLVLAFVRTTPVVVTAINLATMLGVNIYNTNVINDHFIILFALLQTGSCLLGYVLWKGIHTLQNEKIGYMKTQDGILEAFGMSRQELLAYLQMCRSNKKETQSITNFFNHLDEQSEKNIIRAVEQRKAELRLQHENFAEIFPQLTPTELQVCRLVMNGNTLNDIARIMDKSTNNISTVRIHIRKKLQLKPGDDLKQYLQKAVRH